MRRRRGVIVSFPDEKTLSQGTLDAWIGIISMASGNILGYLSLFSCTALSQYSKILVDSKNTLPSSMSNMGFVKLLLPDIHQLQPPQSSLGMELPYAVLDLKCPLVVCVVHAAAQAVGQAVGQAEGQAEGQVGDFQHRDL
jgi:hypothetical protein